MIREFVNTFLERQKDLKKFFTEHEPNSYYDIVYAVVQALHKDATLLPEEEWYSDKPTLAISDPNPSKGLPHPKRITEVDDGNWSGTLVFLIAADVPMPSGDDYWFLSVSYGSCPFCDPLQQAWGQEDKQERVEDYMCFALQAVECIHRLYGDDLYWNSTSVSWIAKDLVAQAQERQPEITDRIANAVWKAGGVLKQDAAPVGERVRREILRMLAKGTVLPEHKHCDAIEECVGKVQNALRYAVVLPTDGFVEHYWMAHEEICSQGFRFLSSDNRFLNGDDAWLIGIIVHLQDKDGFIFEVQFHTQASYEYALVAGQISDMHGTVRCCGALRELRESLELPEDSNLSLADMRESRLRARGWDKARKPKRWKDPLE